MDFVPNLLKYPYSWEAFKTQTKMKQSSKPKALSFYTVASVLIHASVCVCVCLTMCEYVLVYALCIHIKVYWIAVLKTLLNSIGFPF